MPIGKPTWQNPQTFLKFAFMANVKHSQHNNGIKFKQVISKQNVLAIKYEILINIFYSFNFKNWTI